jgi:hypothetical protein
MGLVFDEQLATLLLQHLMTDEENEGWSRWGRLCFVNKACAIVFREHASQLVDYSFRYMYFLVNKKNRELCEKDQLLWLWMKNCECRVIRRAFHISRESGDESDSETDPVA